MDAKKMKKEMCSDILFQTIKKGEEVIGELLSKTDRHMLFPSKVKKIMQIIGITTEEEEALHKLLLIKALPEITEDWIEKKTKELITMVSGLYPHEGNACVIPKNKARDFIYSFIDELALKIKQSR